MAADGAPMARNPRLGGVVASSYAAGSRRGCAAACCGRPTPWTRSEHGNLRVVSVSGSRDGLTTPEDIERTRGLLPAFAEVTVVEGAVYVSFGDYGEQPGDAVRAVTRRACRGRPISRLPRLTTGVRSGARAPA